jgi:hypothetical protein
MATELADYLLGPRELASGGQFVAAASGVAPTEPCDEERARELARHRAEVFGVAEVGIVAGDRLLLRELVTADGRTQPMLPLCVAAPCGPTREAPASAADVRESAAHQLRLLVLEVCGG